MFSEAGQPLHAYVARGGGKGGGGGGAAPVAPPLPRVYTDPVNGMTFTDDPTAGGGTYNYGGGSYGIVPTDSNAKTGSQKLNEEIAQRMKDEQAKSDAATAATTQAGADKETAFQTSRQKAYDDALAATQRQFQLQGVDPSAYMASDITPALQRQFNSIQDLDPNPAAAFPQNLGSNILNDITSGRRTSATNQLNSIFTPTYSQTAIPDTTVDPYISDIVNKQFDPLSTSLLNAEKRGTLTPTGYNAALDTLNTKKSAATSTVRNLGTGILGTDRKALDDYISGARSDVNSMNLGTTFDPNTYSTTAASKAKGYLGDFGGALTSAVGDTQFATLGDLINAGGTVQGANNPTAANPLAGAGYVPPVDDSATKRGLGSTGAF